MLNMVNQRHIAGGGQCYQRILPVKKIKNVMGANNNFLFFALIKSFSVYI